MEEYRNSDAYRAQLAAEGPIEPDTQAPDEAVVKRVTEELAGERTAGAPPRTHRHGRFVHRVGRLMASRR